MAASLFTREGIEQNYKDKNNIAVVVMAVRKGVITKDEYKEITSFVYPKTSK